MNKIINPALLLFVALLPAISAYGKSDNPSLPAADARTVIVNLVVLEQAITFNRLGANLPNGKIYALERDIVSSDHPYDEYGNDANIPIDPKKFKKGEVRLRSYKRPRPVTLRANQGDVLIVNFRNLLPSSLNSSGKEQNDTTVQVFGLQWLSDDNNNSAKPGGSQTYKFYAAEEGVFMLMSPNGSSIPNSNNDHGLFGSVNVQPRTAEWYRSQVTHDDLKLATYRMNDRFRDQDTVELFTKSALDFVEASPFGLPDNIQIQKKTLVELIDSTSEDEGNQEIWKLRFQEQRPGATALVSEVTIDKDGYVVAKTGQPIIDYSAKYPSDHARARAPVLDMLIKVEGKENTFELVHSDLTAIITGPNAGRFPFYLDSPSFRENPASPDRRQPYREFTINYHISPLTQQAFDAFTNGPLATTLAAGKDDFAINYGIAGIGPEIYANRINVGPMGINKDGVDLLFEEFFLSSWAVGDPAMVTDFLANNPRGTRASKALYPDDPSNVYHSYMRDHVKFRILNAGSVAPHVHHQHAHQWLHSPNSDDGHYLDSQMINPGSTYTLEMTYNGSGNRNQTVGDSIFHCHFYPHFAQGMWSLWRVHDVFETGTMLDKENRPLVDSRALPDGEIKQGSPIPGLVPLPTIGMAPLPAKIHLVDSGRQVEVVPEGTDKDGKPIYKNPGFPFFVPGISGHRAPHPPMDFAWKEEDGEPLLRKETTNPFHEKGEIHYLDGGLPRHVVLGGTVVKEFHSRWDFTKEFAHYDETGKFVSGNLIAAELPELGTAIEKAAMKSHSIRSHATYQPNGLPGNFILNGLPPVPGAPYAAPDVDDNGNSNFEARRYKAAVIQTDVVFNKEGWHYPQQRFITLLDDVKDTISGERAPQPFFFRANTGETIEFWHTNLVPSYYEMDDFQIRTPTDILGQHIHLVKFDVTSSDGAGNGFNYEDGTFSPDEVRDRINAINANGGLYHFDEEAQIPSSRQSPLKISSFTEDYGTSLGKPPGVQDWNGAQTTVQRFDTDSLLNNEGEDRTLRTVFTHDHFGPSTHQQVGLYGALLIEPAGSSWIDAITGQPMNGPGNIRSDGGPTSWQAIIETQDSEQSYREFAIAMGDLQLAYLPQSQSSPERPTAIWFKTPNYNYSAFLNQGTMPDGLRNTFSAQGGVLSNDLSISSTGKNQWTVWDENINEYTISEVSQSNFKVQDNGFSSSLDLGQVSGLATAFSEEGVFLNSNVIVTVNGKGKSWTLIDNTSRTFQLSLNSGIITVEQPYHSVLEVKTETIEKGWSNPQYAIWAPTTGSGIVSSKRGPNPTIISDPGGSGNIGTWVTNYRNEPLDGRVQGDKLSNATDPSFAFSSIKRENPLLNRQPKPGEPINPKNRKPDAFKFPALLLPEGSMFPTDPFTPLLRAYANDDIEVRAIVGAVDSVHSFRIQAGRWEAEPSSENSGFRDVQGMAISEHFEMPFKLDPAAANKNAPPLVDYLYSSSSSTQGLTKGTWGILRSYRDEQNQLAQLPNNPVAGNKAVGFFQAPEDAQKRSYTVDVFQIDSNGTKLLQYTIVDTSSSPPSAPTTASTLVLRAAAGEWIEVTLNNKLTGPLSPADFSSIPSSGNSSISSIKPFTASSNIGLHTLLLSYDALQASGMNVGMNGVNEGEFQTVAPGQSKTFSWYAGDLQLDENGEQQITPIEFGAVNLLPSDPLLQQSYGLFGALIIEPANSMWELVNNDPLVANVLYKNGDKFFTEVVIAGNATTKNPLSVTAAAGTEVRFRVLNSGNASPGNTTDGVNVIIIDGHEWEEEPFKEGSTVIGHNPLAQAMGTQQVTPLESYNMVLPKAGGKNEVPGEYKFYYYPTGTALGTLSVIEL